MIHSYTSLPFSDCRTAAQGAMGRVQEEEQCRSTLGSQQTAPWPSALGTSAFTAIICDHLHNLKMIHYAFLLLPTPEGFGLARQRQIFKDFSFMGHCLHFTYPFHKSKETFCLERWTLVLFYPATHEELVLLAHMKKAHAQKLL